MGAVSVPGGVRKAGCEKLLGSPCVTLRIWRKKGVAQKWDPRSLPQAVTCFIGDEGRESTSFAF